ncbi:UNVERIFIED_CONTAM: 60S ribosomal protein L24-2 [Sesamum indicum]
MGLKTLGEKFQQGYCVVSLETAVYIRRGFRVSSTAEKKKEAATSDRFTTMVLKFYCSCLTFDYSYVAERNHFLVIERTELCRFSGAKIYPGKGIRFIRSDSQVFLFANSKCKRYFHNRLRPAKLTWTAMYRKQHKKDIAAEAVKKRRRTTKKPYSRSIVGATLEVIQKRRAEKPEVRDAAREAALREIKERIKKTKDEKKAKKAETMSKQKTSKGSQPKGAMPKGPKIGGGGGKR